MCVVLFKCEVEGVQGKRGAAVDLRSRVLIRERTAYHNREMQEKWFCCWSSQHVLLLWLSPDRVVGIRQANKQKARTWSGLSP